jgi:hypothetical protein
MFWLIARELHSKQLALWFFDLSDRPSGYLDFDIRSLDLHDQIDFWSAADRALSKLMEEHGPGFLDRENAYGANCLAALLEMRKRELAGESPLSLSDFSEVLDWDNHKVDLSDLWSSEDATAAFASVSDR